MMTLSARVTQNAYTETTDEDADRWERVQLFMEMQPHVDAFLEVHGADRDAPWIIELDVPNQELLLVPDHTLILATKKPHTALTPPGAAMKMPFAYLDLTPTEIQDTVQAARREVVRVSVKRE